MFNLNLVESLELERIDSSAGRKYKIPSDTGDILLPSITTILACDTEKAHILKAWEESIGTDVAKKKTKMAADRGTRLHSYTEKYLLGQDFKVSIVDVEAWRSLKVELDKHVSDVYLCEGMLYSKHLRAAGTVDIVCKWDGKVSIVDVKTSGRLIYSNDEIPNYHAQCAAYAVMFEERYGKPIGRSVVLMACDVSRDALIFTSRRDDYISRFLKLRDRYEEIHNEKLS